MSRDKLVDRIAANAAPDSEKPNVVNRALRAAGENSPPAHPLWLRPLANYDRREAKEFGLSRFG